MIEDIVKTPKDGERVVYICPRPMLSKSNKRLYNKDNIIHRAVYKLVHDERFRGYQRQEIQTFSIDIVDGEIKYIEIDVDNSRIQSSISHRSFDASVLQDLNFDKWIDYRGNNYKITFTYSEDINLAVASRFMLLEECYNTIDKEVKKLEKIRDSIAYKDSIESVRKNIPELFI